MAWQLDPHSPNGISKKPDLGYTPYFAGGPGKPSLLDSVNGKHGAVRITGGTNVTVDNSGTDIRISATGDGGGGASAWGDLTGTLSDQTDLQAALDDKADAVHTHTEADITDLGTYLTDVDIADITATGTPGNTTYLRGDGTWATPADTGLTDIVEDTTPQLGGDLDLNTHSFIMDNYTTLRSGSDFGSGFLALTGADSSDPGNYSPEHGFATPEAMAFYSNAGFDALGSYEPYLSLSPTGTVSFINSSQGDAADRKVRVEMAGGMEIVTDGFAGLFKSDNLTANRTLQLPDVSGTLALTGDVTTASTDDRARANHTGTQTAATISDFSTAADARVAAAVGVSVQAYDADLTTIAGLTPTTDNFIQSKGSAWASRTVAQVKADLGLTGTNSGDQTSIVGITGTMAQFDAAVSDGNIAYQSGAFGTPSSINLSNATSLPTSALILNGTATSFVITDQGTTSTSYTDLATVQSVTVTVGASGKALVFFSCGMYNVATVKRVSVAVSGASTVAASDDYSLRHDSASFVNTQHYTHLFTGLTPGSTTFTMKFKTSSGTGQFFERRITVEPL